MAAVFDTDSSAYKKAKRQFHKTTKNRPQDFDTDWSPFRSVEKHFKARFPPPDLANALDFATLDPQRELEIEQGVWRGSSDPFDFKELHLKKSSDKKAYVIPRIPGAASLVVIPSFVSPSLQLELIHWALCKHSQHNETNLHVHYNLPGEGLWNAHLNSKLSLGTDTIVHPKARTSGERPQLGPRQLVNNTAATPETFDHILATPKPPQTPAATLSPISASSLIYKLRWANIGWFYHWGTKQYDFTMPKAPVDPIVRDICRNAIELVDWDEVFLGTEDEWADAGPEWKNWYETYEPDAGIVNFYQVKDTLMGHVDRSEVCATSPLVSISLGNAAVFLVGGKTRDVEPIPLILRSGDVVVMSGPECRRAYHGVPRILEGTLPSYLHSSNVRVPEWHIYEDYMKTSRINVNVRQVFPKGFDPVQKQEQMITIIELYSFDPTGILDIIFTVRKHIKRPVWKTTKAFSSTFTFPANARLPVNRLITSKDHASVQISIADVDANGVALGTSTTFALSGQVRSQGESDDSLNRLATKAGLLRNVWSYQK